MATANTIEFENKEGDHADHELVLTVSQKGHPQLGQTHTIKTFTKLEVDPGYTFEYVPGKLYPRCTTSVRSEGGKITLEGVTDTDKTEFMQFFGDGAVNTIFRAVITKRLPGMPLQQWAMEGLILPGMGMKSGAKEGTGTNPEGAFLRLLWPNAAGEPTIDPLAQNF